ncbi:unnamed protein product, partial [Trichogramma brassicae]
NETRVERTAPRATNLFGLSRSTPALQPCSAQTTRSTYTYCCSSRAEYLMHVYEEGKNRVTKKSQVYTKRLHRHLGSLTRGRRAPTAAPCSAILPAHGTFCHTDHLVRNSHVYSNTTASRDFRFFSSPSPCVTRTRNIDESGESTIYKLLRHLIGYIVRRSDAAREATVAYLRSDTSKYKPSKMILKNFVTTRINEKITRENTGRAWRLFRIHWTFRNVRVRVPDLLNFRINNILASLENVRDVIKCHEIDRQFLYVFLWRGKKCNSTMEQYSHRMRSSYRAARDYVQLGFSRGLEKQREHHFADSRFRKMPREIDISSAAAAVRSVIVSDGSRVLNYLVSKQRIRMQLEQTLSPPNRVSDCISRHASVRRNSVVLDRYNNNDCRHQQRQQQQQQHQWWQGVTARQFHMSSQLYKALPDRRGKKKFGLSNTRQVDERNSKLRKRSARKCPLWVITLERIRKLDGRMNSCSAWRKINEASYIHATKVGKAVVLSSPYRGGKKDARFIFVAFDVEQWLCLCPKRNCQRQANATWRGRLAEAKSSPSPTARHDVELDQNPENWRAQKISVASNTRVHAQLDMQSHSPTIIWCELQLRRPYECHVKSRRGLPMLAALPRRARAATVNAHYALRIAIMPTFLPL